jgi:hypothetical protein
LGRKVVLSYEYRHLKDFVDPAELRDYLAAYKKINDHSAFELTYSDKSNPLVKGRSTISNPVGVFPALYTLLAVALVMTIIIRKNKRNHSY